MVQTAKFKIIQIKERLEVSDEPIDIISPCWKYLKEEFESCGEADIYRSFKENPLDYLIIQTW